MSLIKANAHQVGDYTLTNEGGKLVINQGTPDTVLNPVGVFGLNGLEVEGGTVQDVLDAVTGPTGAASVGYTPAGTGSVATTVQSKLRESVSIKDFGAIGNGTTDDTNAILAALASGAKKVIVTADTPTPLISSMVTVFAWQTLEFEAGGKNATNLPAVRFIKAASMTGPAIKINSRGRIVGGGLECQVGNSGDGVWLSGNNAQLSQFMVKGAGQDGVRVGVDGTYVNTNSCYLDHVISVNNGRHGIYLHDGVSNPSADANAGTLLNCEAAYNGGDGIKVGRAWWWTIINALTEVNTGWGLNLSNVVTSPDTVAECRYANIFGGDFNESNVSGSLNVAGYACAVFMANANQLESLTGTFSNVYGARAAKLKELFVTDYPLRLTSGSIAFPPAQIASSDPNTLDDYEEGAFTPTAIGDSVSGVGTYTIQTGEYTKIGNRVFFNISLGWSAHTGSGLLRISGLPFESTTATSVAIHYDGLLVGSGKQLTAQTVAATIRLYASDPAGGASNEFAMDTSVSILRISGSYKV